MVPNIGKAQSGRNPAGSCEGSQDNSLLDTVTFFLFQNEMGLVIFSFFKGGIRIVADFVPHEIEELPGLFSLIINASGKGCGQGQDIRMVPVHKESWLEIGVHARHSK